MRLHGYRPGITGLAAASGRRRSVALEAGTRPRNGLPEHVPYVYRGTGADTLTAFMDDDETEVRVPTERQERIAALADLRLTPRNRYAAPPGAVTVRQAAELLGVTPRTIERYKAELREAGTS